MIKLFNDTAEQTADGAKDSATRRVVPALLAAVLVFMAGLALMAYLDHANLTKHQNAQASEVRQQLSLLKNRLESALDQRLFLGQGMEALVRSQHDISPAEFDAISRILLAGRTGVRSIALTRNNVVTHVFPLHGNRQTLGSNLLARPELANVVMEAVAKRSVMMAGPYSLDQGGLGLAAITPVFLHAGQRGQPEFWGLVSVIIEADTIFDEAGFRTAADRIGIRAAVRGRDGLGAGGGMVWGEPSLFDEHPITIDIDVPGGKWRLAAIPLQGWSLDYPSRLSFWSGGASLTALISFLSAVLILAAFRSRIQVEGRDAVKRELTESEERFRRLAEAAWEGLVIHDWAHIYDFNTRLVEMTGYAPDDIKRMSVLELVHPEDRAKFQNASGDVAAGQSEVRLCCKDKHEIVAEARGADLFFRGRVLHVTSLRDVTKTKEAEKALVTARDAAQMANRVKSEFLANMSHELRTPLNAVLGFSDIMEQELLGPLGTPRYKTFAHDIQVSARHLLDIINDILDISRVEAGTMDLYETIFDPVSVARSSLRLLEARALKTHCTLVLDLPDESLPAVVGDQRRIKQILLNLLSNAVKFTPEGGKVTLTLRQNPDESLLFRVTDTGIGMSPQDIQKAMTPFMQVDSGMNRRQEGTGLGLPLAQSMIEMHGGTMTVESEPGKGTSVGFFLPAERVRRAKSALQPGHSS